MGQRNVFLGHPIMLDAEFAIAVAVADFGDGGDGNDHDVFKENDDFDD